MKHLKLFLALMFVTAGIALTPTYGQDQPPPADAADQEPPNLHRPNLLAELGLTPEQVMQIRRANQQRRPLMMEAQRKMREANRNLDLAIYGDSVSDTEFQTRLKEFSAAQSELQRLRFEGELAVRKILTPEQLIRFREMRRRFAEARNNNRRQNRMDRRDRPMQDRPFRRPVND